MSSSKWKGGLQPGRGAHLLVQVGLGPSVVSELELGGHLGGEVGVEDAEGVEIGGVVTSDLVRSNEELNLQTSRSRQREQSRSGIALSCMPRVLRPEVWVVVSSEMGGGWFSVC